MGVRGDGAGRAGARLDRVAGYWRPSVALGFLYLGTLPSTVQSATSYSSLAGGNVALSVVGAALLNILGVFVTVPLFLALGGRGSGAVGMEVIGKIMLLLILPFAIGQMVQGRTGAFIAQHKPKIARIDRFAISAAVYVAFSGAVEQGIWSTRRGHRLGSDRRAGRRLPAGRQSGRMAGGRRAPPAPRADRIAFLFAGAQKSAAVGAPLATILFPTEEAGRIVIALLLYHFFQAWSPRRSLVGWLRHRGSSGWRRLCRTDHQEAETDQHRAEQSGDRFGDVIARREQHDHAEHDDRPEGPVFEIAILRQTSRSRTRWIVIERTNIAPTERPRAMIIMLFDSAKAPITPSKLKLASSTSR